MKPALSACIMSMIAIVDDDASVREALQQLVRALGYSVSTFGSAEEFLNSEQVADTSCLITDVQMPGLSGIDLQNWLIAKGHRIPIIFLTGHSDETLRKHAIKAGALAFLSKPLGQHDLANYLEKTLKAN